MIDLLKATPISTILYFTSQPWGSTIEDDKYFTDEELEDNFICFCAYSFSHMNLPRPTYTQFMIALHVSDKSHPHRMVWASRGLRQVFIQSDICSVEIS